MKFYLAPLEGITNYIYRNAYIKYFGGIDVYFSPFIAPTQSRSFKSREIRDILPENNKGITLIPQILTNDADGFIYTAQRLKELGYNEINLNLGCPSGTVASKGRGSGFLGKKDELDIFLYKIYKIDMQISIKTRIGKDTPDEFYKIIEIYNKYPLKELIIHPRTRQDFYKNVPNLEMFEFGLKNSNTSICYNGNIFTPSDYDNIKNKFENLDKIMLARGIIANPSLVTQIKENKILDKTTFRNFHDDIFYSYLELFKDDLTAIWRMKELWGYMICNFTNNQKYSKNIKRAQNLTDYKFAVNSLFIEQDLIPNAGLFNNQHKM